MSILESVRAEARRAPPSGIAAVMAYGARPARPDPALGRRRRPADAGLHLRRATIKALRDGETFYTWQGGIPELRDALARYHAQAFRPELFARRIPRRRLRHAGDPAVAAGDRGRGRRGHLPVAGLAEFRRPRPRSPAPGRSSVAARPIRQWLVLRRRQDRSRRHRPHARHLRQLAVEPDRLDRRSCDACRRSSISPAAAICGSSPTRSMRCSTMTATARRPSSTSWSPRTASCSSTRSRRTGR